MLGDWHNCIVHCSTPLGLHTALLAHHSTCDIWTFYLKNWNINNVLVWYHTGFLLVTTLSPFNDHCPPAVPSTIVIAAWKRSPAWWLDCGHNFDFTWKWEVSVKFDVLMFPLIRNLDSGRYPLPIQCIYVDILLLRVKLLYLFIFVWLCLLAEMWSWVCRWWGWRGAETRCSRVTHTTQSSAIRLRKELM